MVVPVGVVNTTSGTTTGATPALQEQATLGGGQGADLATALDVQGVGRDVGHVGGRGRLGREVDADEGAGADGGGEDGGRAKGGKGAVLGLGQGRGGRCLHRWISFSPSRRLFPPIWVGWSIRGCPPNIGPRLIAA
jgi:hypothetical protein